MIQFNYIRDLVTLANEKSITIADIVLKYEAKKSQLSEEFLRKQMKENWQVDVYKRQLFRDSFWIRGGNFLCNSSFIK